MSNDLANVSWDLTSLCTILTNLHSSVRKEKFLVYFHKCHIIKLRSYMEKHGELEIF